MTFQGYTEGARSFFMAIRFNNNRAFFQQNRDWYLRDVREPSLALAEALASAMERIDPHIDARPNRALSRINRDVRFSRDKSPYRDHVFIAFRRPCLERGTTPSFYAEVDVDGVFFGMGFYAQNRPLMDALRCRMLAAPQEALSLLAGVEGAFSMHGECFRRIRVPQELPEALRGWYIRKSFYFEQALPFSAARSSELPEVIGAGFARLKPLYDYTIACADMEEGQP